MVDSVNNDKGIIDASIFENADTLIFLHPAYAKAIFTMAEIKKTNYTVFMYAKVVLLNEVVFSANKTAEKKSDVPFREISSIC